MNDISERIVGLKNGCRIKCNFGVTESIGDVVKWILLSIVTLGLASLVAPYFIKKSILNKTEIISRDGFAVGRLKCDYNVSSSIGHVVLWGLLIILTIGLAAFVYGYYVTRTILNNTYIEYYD